MRGMEDDADEFSVEVRVGVAFDASGADIFGSKCGAL